MAEDGRRGDEEDRGPGAAYRGVAVMESLLEKLNALNYEEEVLGKHNMKNLSRWEARSSDVSTVSFLGFRSRKNQSKCVTSSN